MEGGLTLDGQPIFQGSHHCGKIGCNRPALVAVFGRRSEFAPRRTVRLNVCRLHAVEAYTAHQAGQDAEIVALGRPRGLALEVDYCPHCAYRDGVHLTGHLSTCPYATEPLHGPADCDVCEAYARRVEGPAG